jgi:hypothetical protein
VELHTVLANHNHLIVVTVFIQFNEMGLHAKEKERKKIGKLQTSTDRWGPKGSKGPKVTAEVGPTTYCICINIMRRTGNDIKF